MPRQYTPRPHQSEPAHATWVVAADAGRARIFTAPQPDGPLQELSDLLNPEARLQEHDAVSDRRGQMRGGTSASEAYDSRHTHHEHAAAAFAKDLCRRLGAAQRSGEVARIYLLADPQFLGLLRENLDETTRKLVVQELASDVTRRPIADIRKALPARL